MPMTVNGFGTSVCGGRGNVGWGSFDAMEWLVAVYLPIIPVKAVHTFDWQGEQYRMIPIRWSFDLVLRTFFARWAWGLGIIAIILTIAGFAESSVVLFGIAGALVALAALVGVMLRLTDRRNKAIRYVLGAATIGNCDPANMQSGLLGEMKADTQVAYGTDSYLEASEKLFGRGSYARAMWCARMATALEDAREGDRMTDEILADPEVKHAIEHVRHDASQWAEVMFSQADRDDAPAAEEPVEELPIVKDVPRKPRRDRDEDY
jgi:hypothetical protein